MCKYIVLTILCCACVPQRGICELETECGIPTPEAKTLIIKGEVVEAAEFPWHVGLYTNTSEGMQQICGGTIVNPILVVTAAHCVYQDGVGLHQASKYAVAAGKTYRKWKTSRDDEQHVQKIKVKEIKIPDQYKGYINAYTADIAVLVLEKNFMFNSFVRPICIEFDNQDNLTEQYGKVAGWGLTEEGGKPSSILQTVRLPIVSFEDCYNHSPERFRSLIIYDKICAGYTNGTALCSGDSGGGLVISRKNGIQNLYYLCGIVSTSPRNEAMTSCSANAYTAFTDFTKHLKWFQDISLIKLKRGQSCTTRTGLPGTCVAEGFCPSKLAERERCGFQNLFCCVAQPRQQPQLLPSLGQSCTTRMGLPGTCVVAGFCPSKLAGINVCRFDNLLCCVNDHPQQGVSCTTPEGLTGTCTLRGFCRSPYVAVRKRCGFQSLVCCVAQPRQHVTQPTTITSPSVNESATAITSIMECGIPTIIGGGQVAKSAEFPWHVGLYDMSLNPIEQICSGIIVEHKLVVTAAHCVYKDGVGLRSASTFAVAAGKIYRRWNTSKDDEQYVQKINVNEIKIPHDYKGAINSYNADIAVLVLEKNFTFNTFVRPICIRFDYEDNLNGQYGKLAGWGLTEEDGKPSSILQIARLPIVSFEDCYKNSPEVFRSLIIYDKICAGYASGTTLCAGASGGGLVFLRRNGVQDLYYLYGIMSFSPRNEAQTSCRTNTYTTFTDFTKHQKWFQEISSIF